jgi:PAS domain S-box-containing protein
MGRDGRCDNRQPMDLEQARAILNYAHSAFISMDEHGRIAYWNVSAEEVFGLTREQAVGRLLADTVIPERYREAHWRGLRNFKRTGEGTMLNRRVELSALRSDGSEFPMEMTISALGEPGERSFHAFIADISERRAAERERQRLLEELGEALHGSEQRLAVTVNALAEAVTIRRPDNHVVYANSAALERLGFASVEELREADPNELLGRYDIVDEHGQKLRLEDIPSVRLLRGEQPEPTLLRYLNRATGEESWVLLKATAVRDGDGEIEAAVTIIEDVTASRRATVRLEFLARASQILASSLDYQQTLRNVAALAVPQIADWCAVDLFDDEGMRDHVVVAHADPEKMQMAERLRAMEPQELDPAQGLGLVRETGEPALYTEITDEMLAQAVAEEERLRLLRAVGMRAVLIVPMIARQRTIGALTLVSAESGRTFDQGDVEFAEQVAARAAMAVDNARLYSERSAVARTLQRSLLPEALPDIPGWEIAALYRPAGHGNEVGGDFYDFWEVGEDWLMMIGDVTGKGVGAAAVTSLVRYTARAASQFDPSPGQVLAHIDAALKRRPTKSICTALCVRLSNEGATLAAGGHPLPIVVSGKGVREVGEPGTMLGAFEGAVWPESNFAVGPGETMVAITDGVTDVVGEGGERFGRGRLDELLASLNGEAPGTVRGRLAAALDEFQVGAQADDTAIVVMRFEDARVGRSRPGGDGRGA